MEEGVAIESKMVSKRIAAAQKSVEGRNFETRKHLLEYDDVMNKQRETIYGLRRQLMEEPDQREYLLGETGVARDLLDRYHAAVSRSECFARRLGHRELQSPDSYDLCADTEAKASTFRRHSEEIEDVIWEN
jgi:preprotein translocase subunit SecA